jgi:hypothetical protein
MPGGRPQKQKRALEKTMAALILSSIDEVAAWQDLLSATIVTSVAVVGGEDGERENITVPEYNIRYKALSYLTNRRDGMPAQSVSVSDLRAKVLMRQPEKEVPCPTTTVQ